MTTSNNNSDSTYSVPPVERALRLLRHIGNGNKCRNLSRAAKEMGINRTTLIRLIHTLADNRMIEEIEEGAGYRLGPGLISLGAQALHGLDIVQVSQPWLSKLCEATGLSAHLGILDGTDIVYLSRETPQSHLVSNVRVGTRLPAHAVSIGRAILAAMKPADIISLYDGKPLEARTRKTPVTLAGLLEQAETDRSRGFAWSEGNFEKNIGSCAAVIRDHTGYPVGALNVSGQEQAFTDESRNDTTMIRSNVIHTAEQISLEMGFSRSQS